jgi:hypothetical protein
MSTVQKGFLIVKKKQNKISVTPARAPTKNHWVGFRGYWLSTSEKHELAMHSLFSRRGHRTTRDTVRQTRETTQHKLLALSHQGKVEKVATEAPTKHERDSSANNSEFWFS